MGAHIAIALLNALQKVDEFQRGGGRKAVQRKSGQQSGTPTLCFNQGIPCLCMSQLDHFLREAGSFPGKSKGRHLRSSLFSRCDLSPGVAQGVEQTGYLIKRSNVVMQVGEQQALNDVVI